MRIEGIGVGTLGEKSSDTEKSAPIGSGESITAPARRVLRVDG